MGHMEISRGRTQFKTDLGHMGGISQDYMPRNSSNPFKLMLKSGLMKKEDLD